MNNLINQYLFVGVISTSEMHLEQLRFTYAACRPFVKKNEYNNTKKQEIWDIFVKHIRLSKLLDY